MSAEKGQGCLRRCLRWTFRLGMLMALLLLLAFLVVFRHALYERFYLFPKQAEAWARIQSERLEPKYAVDWNEYRGVLHSHSELSHDSAATQQEIIAALKKDKVDFICMTEHYEDGKADYSVGLNGVADGILFMRGYELDQGLMPWGVPEGTVFKKSDEPRALARQIHALGAVLFFSHPEHKRMWDLPELDGMEIYNTHTDILDENLLTFLPEVLLCAHAYPEQSMRLIFDPPRSILARWDNLNKTRHISGIAANDAHQNVGIRAFYTAGDTFLLKKTGEKTKKIAEFKLNAFTRPLLQACFGPLQADRQLFRVELDPYERSCRYVNTHLLAKACTEKDILDALRVGRAFVCFNMLADGKGFVSFIEGGGTKALMGESIVLAPGMQLKAAAPKHCRFNVVRDGARIQQFDGADFVMEITQPGKYRVEAALNILGEWTPWMYANPIEVKAGS